MTHGAVLDLVICWPASLTFRDTVFDELTGRCMGDSHCIYILMSHSGNHELIPFFPMYRTHLFSGKIMSNWGVRPIHRYKLKTFFFKSYNINLNNPKYSDLLIREQ